MMMVSAMSEIQSRSDSSENQKYFASGDGGCLGSNPAAVREETT
jgi:hypothetical protein